MRGDTMDPGHTALEPETHTGTGVLIERWLGGDSEARERVAASHLGPLRSSAWHHPLRRKLRVGTDPDDIASDAWLRILRSPVLNRFRDRGRGSLRKLLYRVLHRQFQDTLRRQVSAMRDANEIQLPCDRGGVGPSPAMCMEDRRYPSPTSEARAHEWLEQVRALLTDERWQVWHAIEIEGCTCAEMAEELGRSDSAVRGVLHRARLLIYEQLAGDDD